MLKLDGEEEGGGDVLALDSNALRVCAAGGDFVGPEGEAGGVGLAVEEVEVVLANEELRVVNGINH